MLTAARHSVSRRQGRPGRQGHSFQGLRDAGDPGGAGRGLRRARAPTSWSCSMSPPPRRTAATRLEVVRAVRRVLPLPLTVGGGVRDGGRRRGPARGRRRQGRGQHRRRDPPRAARRHGADASAASAPCSPSTRPGTRGRAGRSVMRSGRERTGLDAVEWARQAVERGRRRDPAHQLGPRRHRRRLRPRADRRRPRARCAVPIIASGGAAGPAHMAEALRAGADAVLAASILHDGHTTVGDLKRRARSSRSGGAAMIIPSIDLMDGQAVQLVGGREKALDAGDPLAVAEKFAVAGELAVIDLDAALGRGYNRDVIARAGAALPVPGRRRHPHRRAGPGVARRAAPARSFSAPPPPRRCSPSCRGNG